MQVVNIVNRLKEVISKYTDDFSDIISITSLSRVGTTVTATSTNNGLTTGNYISVKGAKESIVIASITRVGNIATITTVTDHKLSDPSLYSGLRLPLYVELSGNKPTEYNGVFELLTVPNTSDKIFTCKVTTNPATPATGVGSLLKEDFGGYNGYKQITTIDADNFTYITDNATLGTPAQGVITAANTTRIAGVATPERLVEIYTASANQVYKASMFATIGANIIYKDGTVASDLTSAINTNESFRYEGQNDFSIYVIVPSKNDATGANASDQARSYEVPILKAIANYQFPSLLADSFYQPTVYVGNESDDYIKAYYVHRFDFLAKGLVQESDTTDFDQGTPLLLIDGSMQGKDITYKPVMR